MEAFVTRRVFLSFLGACVGSLALPALPAIGAKREPRYWKELRDTGLMACQNSCSLAGQILGHRNDGAMFYACYQIDYVDWGKRSVSVVVGRSPIHGTNIILTRDGAEMVSQKIQQAKALMDQFLVCDCRVNRACDKHKRPEPTEEESYAFWKECDQDDRDQYFSWQSYVKFSAMEANERLSCQSTNLLA